jgi:Carboxypeptidase regulatory-like domain
VNFPRERQPGDGGGGYFAGYVGIGVRFTSSDGSFVLTGIGPGVYRISVLAEGHRAAIEDRVRAVPLNKVAKSGPVTFRAGPPVAFRVGAVTTDGAPIADARVTLLFSDPNQDKSLFRWSSVNSSWDDSARGRTGADGWASFPALSYDEAMVAVEATGYARQRLPWRDHKKQLKVVLTPQAVLTGDVHKGSGEPLQGFYVTLSSEDYSISERFGPEDKGRFKISELPAGTWKLVVLDAEGSATLYQGEVTLQAGEVRSISVRAN